MLVLILSPTLAFILDFVWREWRISKKWAFAFICILTLPSILIWLSGYHFSNTQLLWYSIMCIITSVIWAFYSMLEIRFALKFVFSAIATIPIAGITFLGAMGSSWGGSREIISEHKFQNYVAVELGPKLYEDEKLLRIKKLHFYCLIEKTIFETQLINDSLRKECFYYVNDNDTHLVYNSCGKNLTSR